jgi:polyhydroxyalkanoic acid synthase PhaR subunit
MKGACAVPEEGKASDSLNPVELWKRWQESWSSYYETTSRAWSGALNDNKEASTMDLYGLYRPWLENLMEMQEQMKAPPPWLLEPQAAWKQWLDRTMENWRKITEIGGDPLGLTAHWMKLMEETRTKLMAAENIPADPFTFFRQWYDLSSEAWAKVVEEAIGSEEFQQLSGRFLENYASFAKAFRRANEEYFKAIQLPTRSDITHVAELVVSLEEKVDKIEDALDDFEEAAQDKTTQNYLGRIDGKLSTFTAALAKIEAVGSLAARMDRVESRLDALLAALEKLEAGEHAVKNNVPHKSTNAVRRKAQKPDGATEENKDAETP